MEKQNNQPLIISSLTATGNNELRRMILQKLPDASTDELNFQAKSQRFSEMPIETAKEAAKNAFFDVCEVFFARNRDNVPDALMRAFVKLVLERFYFFTVDDIDFAFQRMENDSNNGYKPMQINNFQKPLNSWLHRKQIITIQRQEYERICRERREQAEAEARYYQAALAVYRESLKKRCWLGDPFQASVLFPQLEPLLTEAERLELKKMAAEKCTTLLDESKQNNHDGKIGGTIDMMYLSEERIYKQLVAERVVKKTPKYNINN